jgi:hypothetical protein
MALSSRDVCDRNHFETANGTKKVATRDQFIDDPSELIRDNGCCGGVSSPSSSNISGIIGPNALNKTTATAGSASMQRRDLEIYSPRDCQSPDDIAFLPHSNTLSMLDETTKSDDVHVNLDVTVDEPQLENIRSNTTMSRAKRPRDDEHHHFSTNTTHKLVQRNVEDTALSQDCRAASLQEN